MAKPGKRQQPKDQASYKFKDIPSPDWLPKDVTENLNRVTESFARARHVSALVAKAALYWENRKRAIKTWQNSTQKLRISISPHVPQESGAPGLLFNEIVDQYFLPDLSGEEERDPMALLARVLNGAIDTATFAQRNFEYPSPRTFEAQLWFLWASIIFGVLREAKVPLRYEEAKRLLPGRANLLELLQSRLPESLQRKQGAYSPRSAAVVAFRFSGVCKLHIMREVFDHWTRGDVLFARSFTPSDQDGDNIFMFAVQFERYFLKATGRARKKRGMVSGQN